MHHQDWTNVRFVAPPAKTSAPARPARSSAAALDAETEVLSHVKVSHELKVALRAARNAKGWTQKQLAAEVATNVKAIEAYEQGKGVPDNAFVARLERALRAKLPRVSKSRRIG